ncbi:MAG: hypothetical protein JWL83_4131 [Actinomycetia bacterium]|nr:hypothetical protein [Actinomycetes bacterium]
MTEADAPLALMFRLQAAGCRHAGSPFYADLCDTLAADAERGGAVVGAMGKYAAAGFDDAYHLRLLAGVHRMVLAGEADQLRAHYPSTGGDGDANAAWSHIEPLLRDPPDALLQAFERPLQTNEVGRSASLAGGLATVAHDTGLPLRLLEIGSSAGLNLRMDRYYYEAAGGAWGDASSAVRFVDLWDGGAPPFDGRVRVVARRGCDLAPIDVSAPGADVTLLSFVWPGQVDRFDRLRDALAIARSTPVDIDAVPVDEWLPRQLAALPLGVATVVFHSVVWQYIPEAAQAVVAGALQRAGALAGPDAPLAWLRLEPATGMTHTELRCTTWPGGEERLLATAGFHAGRVHWIG